MITDLLLILGPAHRRRLFGYLAWVTAFGVVQGVATVLLVPFLEALLAGDTAAALAWTGALLVAVVAACVLYNVQAMAGFGVALVVLTTLHERVGDHVSALPLGWFSAERVGRLSRITTGGTMTVAGLFAHLLTPLVVAVVTPATIVLAMLLFDPLLALAALVCVPVLWLAFRASASWVGRGDALDDAAAVEAGNRVVEFARTQRVLRAFGRGAAGHRPLEDAIDAQQRAGRRSVWLATAGIVAGGFAVQVAFSALILTGTHLVLGGSLDSVRMVALLALAARFTGPLAEVGDYAGVVRIARNDLGRLVAVLREEPLPEPHWSAQRHERGAVELDGVGFGYDPSTPVLRGVTLRVAPRETVALVGASGSGKTTVTRLVARFWDVDSGTVRVGGADVRDQTTEDLMAQLALVFQDVYLFDGTLEDNVRLGRPDASAADVAEAARLAGVTEIVERLPDGWATRVGEGGTSLSGGERQRVSVARALLKDADIVLLDEATAALDPENERFFTESMRVLARRSTVLVIAHRLPTVVAADRIVVLHDGGIAEAGTHAELLERGGRYAAFWESRRRARGWRLIGSETP
ncbi:ABC transporter ATP-binding protein/permease [Pseudonocardia sp. DR1-2]|uniref:ABC transporter ATP-binding protein n=1 Tax=Pseudonocardia sp. DR1-2 TaxID=2951168 RepID=UPI0020439A11|nr:ABC transporter ATP-binding protein [Pseudonocardia sp. DR1-2]MCM3845396.1 ABC transporter ATP-binding protein/permease [Pseudonocardia sp. DR1-2]